MTKQISGHGLSSIGVRPIAKVLTLHTTCREGPVSAINRQMSFILNEDDTNWLIAYMASSEQFAEKMQTAIAERNKLLSEAEHASVVRRLRITGRMSDLLLDAIARNHG